MPDLPTDVVQVETLSATPQQLVVKFTNRSGQCINMWVNVRNEHNQWCDFAGGWSNVSPGESRTSTMRTCGWVADPEVTRVTTCSRDFSAEPWIAVKLNNTKDQWLRLAWDLSLDEVRKKIINTENVFFFPNHAPPEDKEAQNALARKVFEINNGLVYKATIGANFNVEKDTKTSTCSGECFCVITSEYRRCETKYCSDNWCWWVPCGSSC